MCDGRHFSMGQVSVRINQEDGAWPQPMRRRNMNWRKATTFMIDCAAVLAGVLIAAPFVFILASPFVGGF